ncbi:MAG: DUF370 domain-containing protein [Oscillospiraceae bacterium]|jgi:hypothetical protein|nr:DUF370 domain-containing protein [Oscillospiraceae bacterium]
MKYNNISVHIGGGVNVYQSDIEGVFDIERVSVRRSINDFLGGKQRHGEIYLCSYDMPRAFVVCKDRTYVTNVSALTIKKRIV